MIAGLVRRPGLLSALGLAASGLSIALMPRRTGDVLRLSATTPRGVAEMRAGLGGTYAALGLWAALRGTRDAYTAVGVTWLGAAAFRVLSLRLDDPETDTTYWAYLAGELVLGTAGLAARSRA